MTDDLPHWLIRLARQVARDCRTPGEYVIVLRVTERGRGGRAAVIGRWEVLRRLELEKGGEGEGEA